MVGACERGETLPENCLTAATLLPRSSHGLGGGSEMLWLRAPSPIVARNAR